jgi:hypothetical protein
MVTEEAVYRIIQPKRPNFIAVFAAILVFGDGRGTAVRRPVSRVTAETGAEEVMHAVFPRHYVRSHSTGNASHQRGQ